jgi:drug/metabolite transporter (DMT)-like permease
MAPASRVRDWGLLLVCNLIWGSQFVFLKRVQQQMGPIFATLFPLALTVIILYSMVKAEDGKDAAVRRQHKMRRRDIVSIVLLGVLGQGATLLFGTWAVRLTLASDAALVNLALPVTTAVMAYLLLGERMTLIRAISFILAIVGVLECSGISLHGLNMSEPKFLLGNALCFLSVAGSAFYNTYSKTLLATYSVFRVILYTDTIALIVLLPFALYLEPESFRNVIHFGISVWVGLLFLALLRNLLALVLFLQVLKRLDATVVGLSNYLIPFFGVLTAAIFLGERFTPYMFVGGLLVLCSTLLTTISDDRRRQRAAAVEASQ